MAAVPSVVYGLWGFYFLSERVIPLSRFLSSHFGWIPLLGIHDAEPDNPLEDLTIYKSSTFITGIVVAIPKFGLSPTLTCFSRRMRTPRE